MSVVTTLSRVQTVNRTWEPDDFGAALLLLGFLHQSKRRRPATVQVAFRIWGFPRAKSSHIAQQIREQAQMQIGEATVTEENPDTLLFTLPPMVFPPVQNDGTSPQTAPMVESAVRAFRLFTHEAFNNLVVSVRASFSGEPALDMTFYGVIRGERFWLLSVWPGGHGQFPQETFAHAAWPQEPQFVTAAYDTKMQGAPPPEATAALGNPLFPEDSGQIIANFVTWYLDTSGNRLAKWSTRVFGSIAVIILGVWFLTLSPLAFLRWFIYPVLFLSGLGLMFHVGFMVLRVFGVKKGMAQMHRLLYSGPIAYRDVNLADTPDRYWDTMIQKVTGDLEAMGAVYLRDVAHDPQPPQMDSTLRLFHVPDSETLLVALFLHRTGNNTLFPAKCTLYIRTDFTDGTRIVSVNGGGGFRKSNPQIPATMRVFDESDPLKVAQLHQETVAKLQNGRTVKPLDRENVLDLLLQEHEEARTVAYKNGYFGWGDSVRMVFDRVRSEYK